ncbi:MAG: PAS domain-containing protein [Anaerolineae bacterium]|nr:PAS domain-containing protein [Anaerolineae bacterium]
MLSLAFTPYSVPLAATTLISAWLAVVAWRRRPGPGVLPLVGLLAGMVWWTVCYNVEISVADVVAKRLLAGMQYIAITLIPVCWLAFALEYTGNEKWLTRNTLLLLLIEPAIIIALALTNNNHELLYTGVTLQPEGSYLMLITHKGPAFWVHWVYSYFVLAAATILLVRSLWLSPQVYRGQITSMLAGTFMPWFANLLYVSGLNPLPLFDFTPLAFSLSGLAFAYSMIRFRLMDIVPVARERVIESMSDAMLLLDIDGRIVDANPAALIALRPDRDAALRKKSILGKPVRAFLAGYEGLAERYRSVEEASAIITVRDGPSTQRHYDMRISPLHNRSGNLTGRVVILRDITELRQADERIRAQNQELTAANEALDKAQKQATEANRLKSEFLATMSHELRTPLNAIIGFSDLMLTGITGQLTEKQEDYVNRVLNNSERLLSMINDLLDVSKIEAGRLEIVEAPFSPRDLIERVTAQLHGIAEKKNLTLSTEVSGDLPPVLIGDAQRLEQIVANLISNAIRFAEQGRVDVRANRIDQAWWMIEVADTGIGIPSHALEYIFDEFRQVDGTTHRQHGGTGLGLAVVKRLTLLMNGKVGVESEVGKGSTFTIQLPLKQPELASSTPALTVDQG